MYQRRLLIVGSFVCALQLLPGRALATITAEPIKDPWLAARNGLYLAQQRECSQRAGPYATQDTAWQSLRQARSQGYGVSSGVFPCYDQYGTRGYCFNMFVRC
jgi:hypothetical protein